MSEGVREGGGEAIAAAGGGPGAGEAAVSGLGGEEEAVVGAKRALGLGFGLGFGLRIQEFKMWPQQGVSGGIRQEV